MSKADNNTTCPGHLALAWEPEKTLEPRPKAQLFASATTSSSSAQEMMDMTWTRHSSRG
ncbi:hypothetical protein HaLaN_01518, partial [Haematococcus lacustris]